MSSRTARIVVAAAFAAPALAGCSGGSGTSKEDFVAAADEVCREADQAISEIGRPRVEEGVLDYVEQAEEISAELVAGLRDLDAPEGDRDGVDRMIDRLERATGLLEPLARATIDRAENEVRDLQQEIQELTDDVNEFAETYGFEVCGSKILDPVR